MTTFSLRRSAVSGVGVLLCCGVSASAQTSLPEFTNGGFEQSVSSLDPVTDSPQWETFPTTNPERLGDNDLFVEDPTVAFEGDWYLDMPANSNFSDSYVRTDIPHFIPVTAGTEYTMSAQFRTPSTASIKGAANIILVRANFFLSSGTDIITQDPDEAIRFAPYDGINDPFPDFLIEDEWIEMSDTGVAPEGAQFVRLSFLHINPFNEPGSIYIDDVRFFEATSEINGDYNDSGLVEQGDLDQVLANWGGASASIPATWINQRPTEGIVDQAELDVVLSHWGANAAPDFSGGSVPEPASLVLLSASGVLLARRRRSSML